MLALVKSSWNVLRHVFFGRPLLRHRLESTTLQPSKVDGIDAVCGLPYGIYALLQYLPVFLSQFSAGLRLLRGPDM